VRCHSSDQNLSKEEKNDDDKILRCGPLARRGNARQHLRMNVSIASFPSEVAELAEGEQHDSHSTQQRDQAQGAPQHGVPRR
jgi:hypothetical protein